MSMGLLDGFEKYLTAGGSEYGSVEEMAEDLPANSTVELYEERKWLKTYVVAESYQDEGIYREVFKLPESSGTREDFVQAKMLEWQEKFREHDIWVGGDQISRLRI